MKFNKTDISKSLHKVFLQEKIPQDNFVKFKTDLQNFIENINEEETEENLKNALILFLNSFYNQEYYINTKERTDLVIHTGKTPKSSVAVLFEIKHPTNKAQMITDDNINCKGFQQLVLYFLRERINKKNIDLKHLILTNIYDWYLFDATEFERFFYKNNEFVKQFIEWQTGQKTSENTELFYNEIAKPFIDSVSQDLSCTYFNIKDSAETHGCASLLYKILSPFHLLKQELKNDSNTLNTQFYYELLHILGLEEQTENGTRFLRRCKQPQAGSLLENTIERIRFYNNLDKIENLQTLGENKDEQIFALALELCIVWLNRILFLKLLEAQLLVHNSGDKQYKFITAEKIKSYNKLDNLFFEVLAVKYENRSENIKKNYGFIPYLNSSLFEPTNLEKTLFVIGSLDSDIELPLYKATILKDRKGNKATGELPALEYFLDFLDAYNFGSDTDSEFDESNKTLINSAVLGLIFEKINGYKEGSFYTPGYITMYMCRETIRRAVVEKFNKKYNWTCAYDSDLTDLFNNIPKISIAEANETVNSITICDPAVGSGHFLVSALNEMIAIKADLKILTDRKGKLLRDYTIKVENDELQIKDTENEKLFQYIKYKNVVGAKNIDDFVSPEKQRVQEAIFHEKKHIIENCLFGVDINQNSVNITRLRLWIELLKNAYYTFKQDDNFVWLELQTLPNIDINIKCGNSLLHRFPLHTDLSKILKSIKYDIRYFKSCVENYKHAESKELKRGYEKSIEQIKSDFKVQIRRLDPRQVKLNSLKEELQDRFLSPKLLQEEYTEEQKKKIDNEREKLLNQIVQLENEISEELSGVIYMKAFEWRFEFPEVLDSVTGDFIGFDIVVGNPPYISGRDWGVKKQNIKDYYNKKYEVAEYQLDLYQLFVELGKNILINSGYLSLIIPNTWLANHNTIKIREYFLKHFSINEIVYTHEKVFPEANVDIVLFVAQNSNRNEIIDIKEIILKKIILKRKIQYYDFLKNNKKVFDIYTDNKDNEFIKKIEKNSKPLQDFFLINRGVHPYRTDGYGKSKFSKGFQTKEDYDKRSYHAKEKLNKTYIPELKGKHIFPYYYIDSNEYISYGDWLAEAREKKYFEGDRIYLRKILGSKGLIAHIFTNENNFIADQSLYIAKPKSNDLCIEYILALLNSLIIGYYFRLKNNEFDKLFPQIKVTEFKNLPIIFPDNKTQELVKKYVNKIIELKKENIKHDTNNLELKIEKIFYKLYKLTEEEIQIIENATKAK